MSPRQKKLFVHLLPFALLLSTSAAFYFLPKLFGTRTAYLLGFLFYWIFWCIIIPLLLIGGKSILHLFAHDNALFGKHKIRNIIFLMLPLLFVYSYEFPIAMKGANAIIIVVSAALSIINGT